MSSLLTMKQIIFKNLLCQFRISPIGFTEKYCSRPEQYKFIQNKTFCFDKLSSFIFQKRGFSLTKSFFCLLSLRMFYQLSKADFMAKTFKVKFNRSSFVDYNSLTVLLSCSNSITIRFSHCLLQPFEHASKVKEQLFC